MKKITIIGGGIHAVTLASGLTSFGFAEITIIDPQSTLGANWTTQTRQQNLKDLRTPMFAHVDAYNQNALVAFGFQHGVEKTIDEIAPNDLFCQHLQHTIQERNLQRMHHCGSVRSVDHTRGRFIVRTNAGHEIDCTHLVVATGLGNPQMPQGYIQNDRVFHSHSVNVHDPKWEGRRICIIGSGLTAATLAIELAARKCRVTMLCRGNVTVSQAEAEVLWIPGRPLHAAYQKITDPIHRMDMARNARIGRGVTPSVWITLWEKIQAGDVTLIEQHASSFANRLLPSFDYIICATGYECSLNDLKFLETMGQLAAHNNMPLLDENFQSLSHPGLFFMGRLAEHQGGPLSRNIPGAQFATRAIVPIFTT